MTLETLIQQIQGDARKEANNIIETANHEAEAIINAAKQQAEKEAQSLVVQGTKQATRHKEKIVAASRHAARELEIQVKESIMEECLQLAQEMLKELNQKDYERMIRSTIKQGQKTFTECAILATRENDFKIAQHLGVKVVGQIDGIGGIIVQSKDGRKQIDHTFTSLLARKRDELRILIARELFDEGEK